MYTRVASSLQHPYQLSYEDEKTGSWSTFSAVLFTYVALFSLALDSKTDAKQNENNLTLSSAARCTILPGKDAC